MTADTEFELAIRKWLGDKRNDKLTALVNASDITTVNRLQGQCAMIDNALDECIAIGKQLRKKSGESE